MFGSWKEEKFVRVGVVRLGSRLAGGVFSLGSR